jgi:ABC-type lipopolysaccharide export system ATPase subunit
LEIVDRAYLMNTGLIVDQGTPQELRAHVDIEGIYMGKGLGTRRKANP